MLFCPLQVYPAAAGLEGMLCIRIAGGRAGRAVVEACHEPDHMEYMLSDGRLDKLKGIINGRDAE